MSATDEEEEWEQAALHIESLSFNKDSTSNITTISNTTTVSNTTTTTTTTTTTSSSAIPMPIRNNNNNNSNDNILSLVRAKIPHPILVSTIDEPIDEALSAGVVNPRERLFLLQIENQILDFLKSTEISKPFPPGLNSFRRMILYRIIQRFRLSHFYVDEANDRGIIVTKTSDTIIPKVLLIDLPYDSSAIYGESTSSSLVSREVSESNRGNDSPATFTTNSNDSNKSSYGSQKKVVMMKRNTGSDDKKSKKELQPNKQSQDTIAAEKVRQYEEAKARIFGLDTENSEIQATSAEATGSIPSSSSNPSLSAAAASSASTIIPSTANTLTTTTTSSNDSTNIDTSINTSINININTLATTTTMSLPTEVTLDNNDSSYSISTNLLGRSQPYVPSSTVPSATTNTKMIVTGMNGKTQKGKKALERDRGADERDPDFIRRNLFNPNTTPSSIPIQHQQQQQQQYPYPDSNPHIPQAPYLGPSPVNQSMPSGSGYYYYDESYQSNSYSNPNPNAYDNRGSVPPLPPHLPLPISIPLSSQQSMGNVPPWMAGNVTNGLIPPLSSIPQQQQQQQQQNPMLGQVSGYPPQYPPSNMGQIPMQSNLNPNTNPNLMQPQQQPNSNDYNRNPYFGNPYSNPVMGMNQSQQQQQQQQFILPIPPHLYNQSMGYNNHHSNGNNGQNPNSGPYPTLDPSDFPPLGR